MDDVKKYVADLAARATIGVSSYETPPMPDFTRWGAVEVEPLRGVRRATAEAMSVAWQAIPHVTQFDHADITDLEASRRRIVAERAKAARDEAPPKITMTAIALKACVAALQEFPRFNASLDAARGEVILKRYYHIGVAVDTEHGLMVPVIRDVDRKNLDELTTELADVAARARARRIDLDEMRGGTFTISNLGGIGGTAFTPIVNWPEVAILGIARGRDELVLRDGTVETRSMLPLCLSYDHRVVDGADAARFTRLLATLLEDPFRLLVRI